MKVEKVVFEDGTYGIRKTTGWFVKSYEFRDLVSPRHWWKHGSTFFRDCKGSELTVDQILQTPEYLKTVDLGEGI